MVQLSYPEIWLVLLNNQKYDNPELSLGCRDPVLHASLHCHNSPSLPQKTPKYPNQCLMLWHENVLFM
ncbi:hypothetical protein EXN66_Car014059 [Channa argus]|uniref:Uncharacterized protein n=1 Tax=Channa argus TaxID=215402 RepID=A0A6G1Q7Y0_CHAAH|nr:hypothetical protein EXN66_Car014059 [Channa argus]